ncbi:PELI-like protein, partial [Mya arenaria]
ATDNQLQATDNHLQASASPMSLSAQPPVVFGELVILGYNGQLPHGNKGRRRSKYVLHRRPKANGVKPFRKHIVKNPHSSKAVQDSHQHSVSYTLSRNQAVIVEYKEDPDTDMFQIGRSSEDQIDFVVMDTVPGNLRRECESVSQSTISRFACRILVERNPPFTARIYAAGFDSARNIFLGEKAVKWYSGEEIDGLTTNGVFLMQPPGHFSHSTSGVCGGRSPLVAQCMHSGSHAQPHTRIVEENNILQDGTLIDLCGATLLWRSAAGRPQCPVGLMTLVLPRKGTLGINDKKPFVYTKCGHVHGQHQWGQGDNNDDNRTCPLCLTVGIMDSCHMVTRVRRRSKYVLHRRPKANGVKPFRKHIVKNPHSSKAVQDSHQHSVSYTLSRNQAVIVEYKEDPDTDMFQ